jgi:hypothetical protein
MNYTGFLRLSFVIWLICSFNCSDNGVSDGGGGIDIGNPAKVCVVDSLNRPIEGATVKLLLSDDWFANLFQSGSIVSDSSSTGPSGNAYFDSLEMGRYNVQIDHNTGGAYVRDITINDSQVVKTIIIKNYGTFSGSIKSDSGAPTEIRIAGSTYSTIIKSDGTFIINKIPFGTFIPVIMTVNQKWNCGSAVNITSSQTTVSNETVKYNSILIDDFENDTLTRKIGRFVENDHVYTAQASSSEATSHYQIVKDGFEGNGLKGTLVRANMWALVGFTLGIRDSADSLWDFHIAKGLSFYAKGRGTINISLESDSLDRAGTYKHHSANVELQSQWKYYIVKFDSLSFFPDFNPDPQIPWNEASKTIKRIEFNALEGDTVQLWLDNLTVDGVSFSDVY